MFKSNTHTLPFLLISTWSPGLTILFFSSLCLDLLGTNNNHSTYQIKTMDHFPQFLHSIIRNGQKKQHNINITHTPPPSTSLIILFFLFCLQSITSTTHIFSISKFQSYGLVQRCKARWFQKGLELNLEEHYLTNTAWFIPSLG